MNSYETLLLSNNTKETQENLTFDAAEKVLPKIQQNVEKVPKKAKVIINESLVPSDVFIMFMSFFLNLVFITNYLPKKNHSPDNVFQIQQAAIFGEPLIVLADIKDKIMYSDKLVLR